VIKSASRSSITNDQKYRSMLAGAVPSSEYLIASTVLTQTEPSVTFDNLAPYAGIYRHLKLIVVGRTNGNNAYPGLQFNQNTSSIYGNHQLHYGTTTPISGAELSRTNAVIGPLGYTSSEANLFGAIDIDILDAFSSTKNKVFRTFGGRPGTGADVRIQSGLWINTSPISEIKIVNNFSDSFLSGTRFSLYGVTA